MSQRSGILYGFPFTKDSYRAGKIVLAAEFSKFELKLETVVNFGKEKSPDFLKKFPNSKLPGFESTSDPGFLLTESDAIAIYMSSDALMARSASFAPTDYYSVLKYVAFSSQELLPHANALAYDALSYVKNEAKVKEGALAALLNQLAALNAVLADRTFLVGERITLADITVLMSFHLPMQYVLPLEKADSTVGGKPIKTSFPHFYRWFNTMISQPEYKKHFTAFKYCDKPLVFSQERNDEIFGRGKKAEEAPKKKKDLLGHLPPSTFVLDEWKRMYSNNDTRTVAMPWFWEHFDKEGYSLWFAEYKHDNELDRVFKTCNYISGVYHRLEGAMKYAFGSLLIFGGDNNMSIKGVWLVRGKELLFNLDEDLGQDVDYFSFRRLDSDSAADKKLVENYFAWDGDFENVPGAFNQGKIFK